MKPILLISLALAALTTAATVSAATREEFRGRWSRDCGSGLTCHLDIDDMKSRKSIEITFSVEGNGETCSWEVDAVYDKGFGGPVAHDSYGNYYFYLTIQSDGRLYSSGTVLQNCGPQPLDQYYSADPALGRPTNMASVSAASTDDAQAMIDYRSVYDHNGSQTDIDPAIGTIKYRKPKKSISGIVKPGALLFKADKPWDIYDDNTVVRGTAYVFKKGCSPAPYPVSGRHDGWHTLVLTGLAPIRERNGCQVIGYKNNGNSTLRFVSLGD